MRGQHFDDLRQAQEDPFDAGFVERVNRRKKLKMRAASLAQTGGDASTPVRADEQHLMFQSGGTRAAKRTPSAKRGQADLGHGVGSVEMAMGLDRVRAARASIALPSPAVSSAAETARGGGGSGGGGGGGGSNNVRETALAVIARYDEKVEQSEAAAAGAIGTDGGEGGSRSGRNLRPKEASKRGMAPDLGKRQEKSSRPVKHGGGGGDDAALRARFEELEAKLAAHGRTSAWRAYGAGVFVLVLLAICLLIDFGAVCTVTGDLCPSKSPGSGPVLLACGTVVAVVGGLCVASSFAHMHNGLFLYTLFAASQMCGAFGAVCVHTSGEKLCGPAGLKGGETMVALSVLLLLKVVHLGAFAASSEDAAYKVHSYAYTVNCVVVGLIFTGWPLLLLVFGSVCVANGEFCGHGQSQAGGIVMIVAGAVSSLAMIVYGLKFANDYAARFDAEYDTPNGAHGHALREAEATPDGAEGAVHVEQLAVAIEGETGEGGVPFDLQFLAYVHCNNAVLFVDLYVLAELFGVFGAICVNSGGSHLCGPSGMRTGTGLVVGCGLLACTAVALAVCCAQQPKIALGLGTLSNPVAVGTVLLTQLTMLAMWAGGAPLLLVFGSLCVSQDQYCGVGGSDGGKTMLAFGALLSLVFGTLVYSENDEDPVLDETMLEGEPEVKGNAGGQGDGGDDDGANEDRAGEHLDDGTEVWSAQLEASARAAAMRTNSVFVCILYISGEVLAVFGAQCVETSETRYCGIGGYTGGVAMLAASTTLIMFSAIMFHYGEYPQVLMMSRHTEVFNHLVALSALVATPLALLIFGSVCVTSGDYCAGGGELGGRWMAGAGAALSMVPIRMLVKDYWYQVEDEDRTRDTLLKMRHTAAFMITLFVASELFGVFGSLCVHTGGQQFCGSGGEGVGRMMLVFCVLLLLAPIVIYIYDIHFGVEDDVWLARITLMSYSSNMFLLYFGTVSAPVLLLAFGGVCSASGRLCGAAGTGGGTAMLISGIISALVVSWVFALRLQRMGEWLRGITFDGAFAIFKGMGKKLNAAVGVAKAATKGAVNKAREVGNKAREVSRSVSRSASFWTRDKPAGSNGDDDDTDDARGGSFVDAEDSFSDDSDASLHEENQHETAPQQGEQEQLSTEVAGAIADALRSNGLFISLLYAMGCALVAPGAACVESHGPVCGAAGSEGGIAMLSVGGAILLAALSLGQYVLRIVAEDDATKMQSMGTLVRDFTVAGLGLLIAVAAPVAIAFGSVCAADDKYCGSNGSKGSAAMTVVTGVLCAAYTLRPAFHVVSVEWEGTANNNDAGARSRRAQRAGDDSSTDAQPPSAGRKAVKTKSEIFRSNRSENEEVWHNAVSFVVAFLLGCVLCAFGALCANEGFHGPFARQSFCGGQTQVTQRLGATMMILLGSSLVLAGYWKARRAPQFSTRERKRMAAVTFPINMLLGIFAGILGPYLLTVYGALCRSTGAYCGVGGIDGGGKGMFATGLVASVILCYVAGFRVPIQSMQQSARYAACALVLSEVLGAFGSICVHTGSQYCGEGGFDGGVTMVVFSVLFLVITISMVLWMMNNSDLLDERRTAFVEFCDRALRLGLPSLSVTASTLMLVFGSICLDQGDHCGPRGHGGGIAMVVVGAVATIAMCAYLWRSCCATLERASNAALVAMLLVAGQTLCVVGSLCVLPGNSERQQMYCGAGGQDGGGGAMLSFGGVMVIAAALCAHCTSDCSDEVASRMAKYTTPFMTAMGTGVSIAGPICLVVFGSTCVELGRHCTASASSGKGMIASGAVLSAWTGYYVWYRFHVAERHVYATAWKVVFGAYIAGKLFIVFGAICVDSDHAFGADGWQQCGVGGLDGGIAMLCIGGALALCAGVAITAMQLGYATEDYVQDLLDITGDKFYVSFPLLACAVTTLLLTFGSWCLTSTSPAEQFCGAGGIAGGWVMVVAGGLLSIATGVGQFELDIEEWDGQTKACVLYFGGELMGVFGGICIATDGARYCGDAGIGGGWAMCILCGLFVFAAAWHRCRINFTQQIDAAVTDEAMDDFGDAPPPPNVPRRQQTTSAWRREAPPQPPPRSTTRRAGRGSTDVQSGAARRRARF